MECLIDNGPFGTKINLDDDDNRSIDFTDGFNFSFYGNTYDSVFVNSNGHLTFNSGDDYWVGNIQGFIDGQPRIAPFMSDLDPSAAPTSGGVFYKQLSDKFIVTWIQVPFYAGGISPYNTFQVVLYKTTGRVGFAYNKLDNTTLTTRRRNVLVGVAAGNGGNNCIFRYDPPLNYDSVKNIYGPYGELDGKQLFYDFEELRCTRSDRECPSRGVLFEIV